MPNPIAPRAARRARTRAAALAAVVLASGCALAAAPARAQRLWGPEERLVLRDYTRIVAVAASFERAYAVTPSAVLLLDPRTRRWTAVADAPSPDALRGVGLALVDPLDQALWLAGRSEWFRYQPDLRLWDRGPVPGPVSQIAMDRADPIGGLYLRTRGGWMVVPRIGGAAMPATAPAQPVFASRLEDALRANPALESFAPQILGAGRRIPARFTSAAPSADGIGWFIGTDGLGLLWFDGMTVHPERLAFGLESDRAAALFAAPGGMWVLTEPSPSGVGGALSWVAQDAGEVRTNLGTFGGGLDFTRAWDLAGAGEVLWAATDAGLLRLPTDDGPVDLLDEGRGLPDRRVYGVATWRGQVYAATRGGLARVGDSLAAERIAPRFPGPAYAVVVRGDTVWAGTPQGVFAAPPGAGDLEQPPGSAARSEARREVGALAWLADTLVALTRDELLHTSGPEPWQVGPRLSDVLGTLRAMVQWRDGFWVAGRNGVAYVTLGGPAGLALTAPADLPGEPTDVAVDELYLWVATVGGLVRFRLDAVQP
jgi:hypothetical protein